MIRTDGRPPINVTRRDSGGYIISQNRNRIWLSESEATQLVELLTGAPDLPTHHSEGTIE